MPPVVTIASPFLPGSILALRALMRRASRRPLPLRENNMSRLVANLEILMKRPLTPEEINNLAEFQRLNEVDDTDPLLIVYALMAKSQLIIDTLPELLQQKALETIELHRQTLREQSTLIAKDLITVLAQNIESANVDWKVRWLRYAGCFVGGALFAAAALNVLG